MAKKPLAGAAEAPEIFADEASSVTIRRNVARFTFTSDRPLGEGADAEPVVVGHLAMSVTGFLSLYGRMDSIVRQLREAGRIGAGEAAAPAKKPAPKAAKKVAKKAAKKPAKKSSRK